MIPLTSVVAWRRQLLLGTQRCLLSTHGRYHPSSKGRNKPYLPRVVERRETETGPGGYSSDPGVRVAIFGASGFLGRYLCCDLGSNGYTVYLANRGDDMEMRHIKPMFELGKTRFVFYSPNDVDSMREVIADADIVVNLIGRYWEARVPIQTDKFPYVKWHTNFTLENTHIDIPRTLAQLCLEMQVDHFIHVSCAAASPNSKSRWGRTKYYGEQAIKEVYPWVTIVRPTQMFGMEDKFFNLFAAFATRIPFVIPLLDGGHALTQPVYVNDVAQTISRIIDAPEKFDGRYVDCFGPSDYTYEEIVKFTLDVMMRKATVVDLPKWHYLQLAKILQYEGAFPKLTYPWITPDVVELWSEDYLPAMTAEQYRTQSLGKDRIFTMEDLGVEATPIEKVAFNQLRRFRFGGHFQLVDDYH